MKNLISAAKTVIVLGAIAAASVGCKQTTSTAPVDTAATRPVTMTADTAAKPKHDNGTMPANHSGAGDTAIGSSNTAGMTGSGTGDSNMAAKPPVRNNTGETQGTTPGTSLPVSDGSR